MSDLYDPDDRVACRYNFRELLEIIDDDGSGLTDWEANFIAYLLEKSESSTWFPSERQKDKLGDIFQQRVVGG